MKRVHILGRKNHGKTQLVVELIRECGRRQISVASIKHTHHAHELDTPGKDSQRHREAGAGAVGVVARNMTAVFLPTTAESQSDPYVALLPWMMQYQLLLVEGDTETGSPKIEVWRSELGGAPISAEDSGILAIVSDDALGGAIGPMMLPRSNVAEVLDWILAHVPDA